ncbi:hypothetical protein H4696_005634 [Amycolatopsis lexingtonensis]|uniref:Uncharacterized protein n=1 Tax=Amycolatopsis lexingtonensis TaxID=218822 RepID=A0ABR9I5U2_9PSEU|nr:hypothetical protein [Amycolatopsis lexingtonensis]MBE1498534.1 hypothetical protein [Amycolatopsis lexingtonensis]
MPRRRPGSLRRPRRLDVAGPPPVKIPYLSRRAQRQLAFAEAAVGVSPGFVGDLLEDWERATRPPFRLELPVSPHPDCDPVGTRWVLARVLDELPRRERALVGAVLSRVDRRFAARTLPDPRNPSPWWFERRLFEQNGWGRL